jgi:hypothetical protein
MGAFKGALIGNLVFDSHRVWTVEDLCRVFRVIAPLAEMHFHTDVL